jgi:hypothetical protein
MGAPGPQGLQGIAGTTGSTGPVGALGPQGLQGEEGDNGFSIPGPQGLQGSVGSQGIQGIQGPWGFSLVGEDGEEGMRGPPGPTGPAGAGGGGGGGAWTDFTKDLGVADRSGTFDITGLSGLTADKVVSIVQTMAQVSSRGNARDEFEFDPITLTGYVVDASTIRALWSCSGGRSVAVGTYAFAYQVGG